MNLDDTIPALVQTAPTEDHIRFKIGLRMPAISMASFKDETVRVIDTRDCAPLGADDENWGEQDSLDNIPKQTQPGWVRALFMDGDE